LLKYYIEYLSLFAVAGCWKEIWCFSGWGRVSASFSITDSESTNWSNERSSDLMALSSCIIVVHPQMLAENFFWGGALFLLYRLQYLQNGARHLQHCSYSPIRHCKCTFGYQQNQWPTTTVTFLHCYVFVYGKTCHTQDCAFFVLPEYNKMSWRLGLMLFVKFIIIQIGNPSNFLCGGLFVCLCKRKLTKPNTSWVCSRWILVLKPRNLKMSCRC